MNSPGKAISGLTEDYMELVKENENLKAQVGCLTDIRRSNRQHMDEQDAEIKQLREALLAWRKLHCDGKSS